MSYVLTNKQADKLSDFFANLAVVEFGAGFLSVDKETFATFYIGLGILLLYLSLEIARTN